jgi:hypothetical protein
MRREGRCDLDRPHAATVVGFAARAGAREQIRRGAHEPLVTARPGVTLSSRVGEGQGVAFI